MHTRLHRLILRRSARLSSPAGRRSFFFVVLILLVVLATTAFAPGLFTRPPFRVEGKESARGPVVSRPIAAAVLAPAAGEALNSGRLVVVSGTTVEPAKVEVSFDGERTWTPAVASASDPDRWRAFWVPPGPGSYRLEVRVASFVDPALGRDLRVTGEWTTSYRIDDPYAVPGAYRLGQVHRHTENSFDGQPGVTPDVVARMYKKLGYGFVVYTDHEVISHADNQDTDDFVAISGYESTGHGHIGALFAKSVVDPNLPAQARIDAILAQGGIASLNHPDWRVGWSGEAMVNLRGYRIIEIFNGFTTPEQKDRLARNLERWRRVLNAKGIDDKVWGVSVSDTHGDEPDGGWIAAKIDRVTPEAVKTALRQGEFYASNGPAFTALGISRGRIVAASPDARVVRFVDDRGKVVLEAPAEYAEYLPTGAERWVRVEVEDGQGRMAWSQPFWLRANQ